jgi:hypothetical protein
MGFRETHLFLSVRDCGRQTSITAGTAMHRSKLPLTAWFWAGWSAISLERTHPPTNIPVVQLNAVCRDGKI